MKLVSSYLGILFAVLTLLPVSAVSDTQVRIGTGGSTGVYFATGQALCSLLEGEGVKCSAPASKGSVANIKALASGDLELAMAQSDWQYHAQRGSSKWDGEKVEDLRAVFSVYSEPMQIVVKRDANVMRWRDIRGKRINIGNLGSGQRQTFEEMLAVERWKLNVFSEVHELPSSEQVDAFCNNQFDAFIYTVGIPNNSMARAVGECNGMLLEPKATVVRKLASAARPYYAKVAIPSGTYWDGQKKVDTFGVKATLVTRANVPDELIEKLLRSVFEDFETFKKLHPAYGSSIPETMISEGLSVPLHDAAAAYYRSKGWIK